jgi:hypothetical protein
MAADRYERRHRRTARNVNCIEVMANADFDAVPSLPEAMGLEEPDGEPNRNASPAGVTHDGDPERRGAV